MRTPPLTFSALAVGLLLTTVGCAKQPIELSGRSCSVTRECNQGYVCELLSNTCVTAGDSCAGDGFLFCDSTAFGCDTAGCMFCEADVWSDCGPGAGGGCEPGRYACDGTISFRCTAAFTREEVVDCGALGCNPITRLCNQCVPGQGCGAETGDPTCDAPNECDPFGRCQDNFAPAGTPCGNQGICDVGDACDGAGLCQAAGILPAGTLCGGANEVTSPPCNEADTCDASGVCQPNLADPGTPCGTAAGECKEADTCNGGGQCAAGALFSDTTPCGDTTDYGICDRPDTCDGQGSCDPNQAGTGTSCGDFLGTPCSDPDSCDGQGSCDPNDRPDGAACVCGAALCEDPPVCSANQCFTCDGGPNARTCSVDSDCDACGTGHACGNRRCLDREHQACSENAGANDSSRCPSVACSDDRNATGSIGGDCTRRHTHSITYEFVVSSPSTTEFHVWLRVVSGVPYSCTVNLPGGRAATFDNARAPSAAGNGDWRWFRSPLPITMDPGNHTLTCTSLNTSGNPDYGYDGFIYTNDLAFVPDSGGCNSDQNFASGTCSGRNWGPNVDPSDPTGPEPRCAVLPSDLGSSCAPCASFTCTCDGLGVDSGACL